MPRPPSPSGHATGSRVQAASKVICTQRGACGCHVALVSDMLARRQRGADGIACRRRGGEQLRCTLRLPLRGGNGCHVLQVADSA